MCARTVGKAGICLCVFFLTVVSASYGQMRDSSLPQTVAAVFTEPSAGILIEDRADFGVAGSIQDYAHDRVNRLHYWVSLASVARRGAKSTPDLHWPKFYVKTAQFEGRIYDGGQNPKQEPQTMMILLLRVDDATNQRFTRWLDGPIFKGFRVNEQDRTRQIEVVANVPIKFP